MALTAPVTSEKMFEECERQMDNRLMDSGTCLYYKLAYEPKGSECLPVL